MNRVSHRVPRSRRGAALVVAVALLGVTVGLLAAAARTAALAARAAGPAEDAARAGLLADAAARLARRRIAQDSAAAAFGWNPDAGAVTVTAAPAGGGRVRVTAVATLAGGVARAERSFLFTPAAAKTPRSPLLAPKPQAAQ